VLEYGLRDAVSLVVEDLESPSVELGDSSRLPVLQRSSDLTWWDLRIGLQPSLQPVPSELQTERSINLEELESAVRDVFVDVIVLFVVK